MAENDPELTEELAEGEPPPLENLGPPPPKEPKPEECPECPGGSGDDVKHIFVITAACVTAFVNNNFLI